MHDDISPPVDLSLMATALGGNMMVLRELIGHLLAHYPLQLKAIGDCIQASDASKLRQLSHTFKGSIANFHATSAVEFALRLEQCGARGDFSSAPETLKRLEKEMHRIQEYLEGHDWESALRQAQ